MKDIKNIQEMVLDFGKKIREDSSETLAKAEAELKGFVARLAEKGRITQADSRKIYNEFAGKVVKGRKDFEKKVDEGTRWLLAYLNLPTKNEVKDLSGRVEMLTRKVRELKKQFNMA